MNAFAALALGTAIALASPASAQTVRWNLSNDYPAQSLPGQADAVFAQRVRELSGGSLEVALHPGGALGYKSQDVFDAVRTGAVQIGNGSTAFWGGINPLFRLSSLPFLLSRPEDAKLLYQASRGAYEEVLSANNMLLLYTAPWPPSGIWANAPINSLEALRGLRIRTYDTNSTTTMARLQARPLQLAWGDVVPQLAARSISAVLTSAEGGVTGQLWEHLNHFTEINYAMPLNMAVLNKAAFDRLSASQQDAVRQAARAAEDYAWQAVIDRTTQNYATMRERGVTVVTNLDPAFVRALIAAGEPVRERWLADMGERGQAIIGTFNRLAGR